MNEDSGGAVNRVGTDHLRDGRCLRDQPNPMNLARLLGACGQWQGSCRGTKPNNEVASPHSPLTEVGATRYQILRSDHCCVAMGVRGEGQLRVLAVSKR